MVDRAIILDLVQKYAELQYKEDEVGRIIKAETGQTVDVYTESDLKKAYKKGRERIERLERDTLMKKAKKGHLGSIDRLKELGLDPMDQIFYKYKPK